MNEDGTNNPYRCKIEASGFANKNIEAYFHCQIKKNMIILD